MAADPSAAPVYGQTAYYSGRTIEGIRYTREVAERDGWYDYGSQAQADVDVLLARIEELEARLENAKREAVRAAT